MSTEPKDFRVDREALVRDTPHALVRDTPRALAQLSPPRIVFDPDGLPVGVVHRIGLNDAALVRFLRNSIVILHERGGVVRRAEAQELLHVLCDATGRRAVHVTDDMFTLLGKLALLVADALEGGAK